MEKYPRVILKPGKEQSIFRFHPWIFSGAIKKYETLVEGDIVEVYSSKNEFLAMGHYQVGSIAIRIFSFTKVDPGESFWKDKLINALKYREANGLVNNDSTNVFRLFNAEGDGIPGLIIDYYGGIAVMQIHTVGIYRLKETLAQVILNLPGLEVTRVYNKSETTMPYKAQVDVKNGYLAGEENSQNDFNLVLENDLQFRINWEEGQKTGFFIDQRENRKLLGDYARERNVLNMFGYTGGFSVYALKGGANLVHTVDSSKHAINLANENVSLNFTNAPHQGFAVDAFEFMRTSNTLYDLVILDPPAFAKHVNVLNNALQGYKRLNQAALEKISAGGILFTFSCSQVVSKENFRKSVFAAAANAKRKVRIMHQLTQPADHPISIYHPEGEYLKGLVLFVE